MFALTKHISKKFKSTATLVLKLLHILHQYAFMINYTADGQY